MRKAPVKLKFRKLVYGVGINDADYTVVPKDNTKVRCPYYRKWQDMLMRCYNEKYIAKNPPYINAIVCDDWLVFSTFKKWMVKQDWINKQLDKDLLGKGKKIYSPKTCCFLTIRENGFARCGRVKLKKLIDEQDNTSIKKALLRYRNAS